MVVIVLRRHAFRRMRRGKFRACGERGDPGVGKRSAGRTDGVAGGVDRFDG